MTFGVGCEASDAGPFVREGGRPPRGNLIITQTALDFNLAQTPAAPIRMGKETQSAHFRFCNSRTRVYVVVESQVHRGTFFLACCRSIQSNARASNRRRVAHPRSPPRPDFVQPALVSELRSRFKHARCVRPWGAEAEDVDSAVAPPVAGAVSAAEAAEAAAAASMRALPTPSPVRSHPHALFPSVRDGSIRTRDPHAEAKARYPRHQLLGFHTQIAAGARRTLVENKLSPAPADLATPSID